MIKTLELHNFQSHKHTELAFDKGVNIIVGSSDSGKTAIIRALRWLVRNRPSGDAIRSHWGGKTEVVLETEDTYFARSKDKQEEYLLNDTLFTAFRTEVPEEITKALNLSEINLQTQLEAPFLLSNTPGEVAQHFNKVAKLDKIDSALQNVGKWIRELTQELSFKKQEQDRLTEELKKFDHLEKFEVDVEVLEEEEKQWLNLILSKNSLDKLSRNIVLATEKIEDEEQILKIASSVDNLLSLYENKEHVRDQYTDLQILLADINEDEEQMIQSALIISLDKPVGILLKTYEDKKVLEKQAKQLLIAISDIRGGEVNLQVKSEALEDLQLQFEESFPEECPLCGSTLKK